MTLGMKKSVTGGKFWNIRYSAINALYFAAFCGVHEFASVYLLAHHFTNMQIGVILALANIISAVVQPVAAAFIDRGKGLTNRNVSVFCTAVMVLLSFMLLKLTDARAVIFVVYILIYMIQMLYQPLIIAMSFEYRSYGCPINFGLARGIGSAGFAVYSVILGRIMEKTGISVIQIADMLVLFVLILFLVSFRAPENGAIREAGQQKQDGRQQDGRQPGSQPQNSARQDAEGRQLSFLKQYPGFFAFLLATVCFFFLHSMSNDYLMQIIKPIGGGTKDLGYVVSLAAMLELPTMAFFLKLAERIDCGTLLKISGVFFLLKGILLFAANDMMGVYLSSILQIGSYAMFIPASAYYVHKIMSEHDQVKGQAFINSAITLGGVFSNLICGYILDRSGARAMIGAAVLVCMAGVLIGIVSIRKVGLNRENFQTEQTEN